MLMILEKKKSCTFALLGFWLLFGWTIFLLFFIETQRDILVLLSLAFGIISLSIFLQWDVVKTIFVVSILVIVLNTLVLPSSVSIGATISNKLNNPVQVLIIDLSSHQTNEYLLKAGESKDVNMCKGEDSKKLGERSFLILGFDSDKNMFFQRRLQIKDILQDRNIEIR